MIKRSCLLFLKLTTRGRIDLQDLGVCVIWTGGCHLLGGLMDLELAYGLDLLLDYPGLNYWLFFPCTCIL